jgi:stage II sporulation protein AA (anti-sigma F factor antagonist)
MTGPILKPISKLRRPGLTVEPLEFERKTVLVLRGEFDLTGTGVFEDAVAGVRSRHPLVLDLRDLTFLDSSGLGAFVVLYERAVSEGWSLVLSAPQPPVAMVLRISGLAQRLTIVDAAV